MADTSSTTTFKADISSLRAEMQAAARAVRLANSEFKAATAGMDDWGDSADGLEAKIKQLESVLKAQNKQVELAARELEKTEQQYGKNSAEADRARIKYNNFKAAAAQTEKALNDYEAELENVGNATEEVEAATERASDGFTVMKGVLADLAASALKAAGRGLKDFAIEAFNVGADFQASMSKVEAVSGASAEEMQLLGDKAKEMGSKTKFSASESAAAFNYMAMAGWKTQDMIDGIEGVMNLAAASGADLATTSDIVTDALTAMGYGAADAGRLADVMAAASSNANTNVEMMGATFQYAAPLVGALGYNMEDTAVAIGMMANAGIKGEKAGTALRSILTRLSTGTGEAQEAMDALGISLTRINEDGSTEMKSLDDVMRELRDSFADLDETQQTQYASMLAGQEAMSGLLAIVNGSEQDFDNLTMAVQNSDGAAKDMADTMNDNVSGALTLLQSNIQGKMIEVFEAAAPAIQEAIEKIGTAIDSVDWSAVAETVGNVAQGFADMLTWLVDNAGTVKALIAGIGAVVGTSFAVTKIDNFIQGLGRLRAAFSRTGTAADTLAQNGGLLSKAFANPVTTGVVGGFVALAAATWLADNAITSEMQSQYELTDAQKETVKKANEMKASYQEVKSERTRNFASINAEKGHLVELVGEYNSLIDENGNVKDGYEERAKFIVGELAEALGVEREDIQKNIGENGKLKDSILDVIEAHRAEAMLSASKGSYQEAVTNQADALQTYQEAVKMADDASANYQKTQEDLANAISQRDAILESGGSVDAEEQAIARLSQVNETARQAYETASDALKDAEEAYIGYNATIQNYEGLAEAVATGDMEAIGEAALKLQHNFQTAETGTKESLTKQAATIRRQLGDMKKAYKSGVPGVTKEMVSGLQGLATAAEAELRKVSATGKNTADELAQQIQLRKGVVKKAGETVGKEVKKGVEVGLAGFDAQADVATNNFTKAIAGKKKKVQTAGEDIGKAATNGAETQLAGFGIIGKKYGEEYADKLASESSGSKKAGTTVGKAAKTGAETVLAGFGTVGTNSAKNYVKAIRDLRSDSEKSGQEIGTSAKGGTELVLAGFGSSGTSAGSSYNSGISGQNENAYAAGSTLASKAKSGVDTADATSSGTNFAQGFINGIGSMFSSVFAKAKAFALQAIAGVKQGQQEGSPSKLTYQSGVYFTQGYINGILSQEKLLVKTVKGMVGTVISEMAKMSNYQFETVGKTSSKIFADRMQKDISYMISKMEYQNEQKISAFDAEISRLEAERDKKIDKLNSGDTVNALKEKLKKEKDDLSAYKKKQNNEEKAEEKRLKDDYNKTIKRLEKESTQKQRDLQKQINATKDKAAKQRLQDDLTAERDALKERKEAAKTELDKLIDATKKNSDAEIAAYERQSKERQKQLEKEITAAEKANKKQLSALEKEYDKLIETQKEYQNAYQTASSQMISEFRQAMDDYSSAAQAMMDDVIDGIVDRYSDRYDELVDKQNSLIDKLRGTGELFKVSGAGVMTVNDLQEQTRQIREYTSKLQKIKNQVSSELFDQIASYDMKEGAAFMDRLLAMSAKDLDAYNKAYTDKLQAAQKAGESIYKSDFDRVASDYKAEINTAFKTLPAQLEELGIQTMKGFVTGLTGNTDYMTENIRTYVASMVDTFKKQLGIRSPSRVMYEIGEYTGEGLGDGLMSMLGYVQHTASELAALLSQPLDLMNDMTGLRSAVSQPGYTSRVGGVVNNYNLVQNNNSPKALSALETYQARRRQIAMIQAFA